MSSETEIKLDLSEEAVKALLSSDLLGEPSKRIAQRSIYFDTRDRRLRQEGFTLRIRRVEDARTQTVKAAGPTKALFARSEWETPLAGDEPVLDHTSPLVGEFGRDLKLEPVFSVVIERAQWDLEEDGSRIEVVIDQGMAVSGDRQSPILEVEIELKDGDPRDLFAFARKIDAIIPFKFGVLSKAERGFALVDAQRSVFKSEPLFLDRDMNAASAFQRIAGSCLRQFRQNEDVLTARGNAESLHQARVALRRLRCAFSLFRPILPGDEPRRLRSELQWLTAVLGEARNVDVLLMKATDADLRSKLKVARDATYRDATDALMSPRARALMLDLLAWLECGDYLPGNGIVAEDLPAASEFAEKVLEKKRKRLKRDGRNLASVDDAHRHDVRKDAKKFRYATEFFQSLFNDKRGARRHRKLLAAMETLQDDLGALNDLSTGPEVLERHGLLDHPARDSVVSHAHKVRLIEKAQAAVDDVLDAKRFWR